MSDFAILIATAVVSILFAASLDLNSGPTVMTIGTLMIIAAFIIRKRKTHGIAKLFKNLIVTNPNADLVGVAEGSKPQPKVKVTPKGWVVGAASMIVLGAMILPGTASGSGTISTPAPTQAVIDAIQATALAAAQAVVDAIQATAPATAQAVEITIAPRSNTLDLGPTATEIVIPTNTQAPVATAVPATEVPTKPISTNTVVVIPPTKAPVVVQPTAKPVVVQPTAKPVVVQPTAKPVATAVIPTKAAANCSPAYPGVCIPPPPPDLDCKDIPYRRFKVLAPDPHRFDSDHDGIGCES